LRPEVLKNSITALSSNDGEFATSTTSTLASHINAVRRAVGDSGQEQRLIRKSPASRP
jgi:hypothetical protein